MPIPDFQSIMRPMLAILADGNVHSMADIHDELCKKFGLTPDEIRTRIASGNQTMMRNWVGYRGSHKESERRCQSDHAQRQRYSKEWIQ